MAEERFSARPYEEVQGTPEYKFIESLCPLPPRGREGLTGYYISLADIVGPLTVRERWELLGSYGMELMRRHVKLESDAISAAHSILDAASRRVYPEGALALKLIHDLADPSPLDPQTKSVVDYLIRVEDTTS